MARVVPPDVPPTIKTWLLFGSRKAEWSRRAEASELAIGDTISTRTLTDSVSWQIVSRRVVNREAPAIRKETGQVLTLTTCWPIGYLGGAPDRLILRAVPIAAHAAAATTPRANQLAIATNASASRR